MSDSFFDWDAYTKDLQIPFDPDYQDPNPINIDEINAMEANGTLPNFDFLDGGLDIGGQFAVVGAGQGQANFASQFGGNEVQAAVPVTNGSAAQAVGDEGHGAQPPKNDFSSQSSNNQTQVESTPQPRTNQAMEHGKSMSEGQNEVQAESESPLLSNKTTDHEVSNSESPNEVQVNSPPQSPNRLGSSATEAEKHAIYAAEYLSPEDSDSDLSDGESSGNSDIHLDLPNSEFPTMGRFYTWQLPPKISQPTNLSTAYNVPPELARIRDPTERHVGTVESAPNVVEQVVSTNRSASPPIIVDGIAQHRQCSASNQYPGEAVPQAPQLIQPHAAVSNPNKRIEHPDADDDEEPGAGDSKRVKIAAPTPKKHKVAKVLKQPPKRGRAQNDSFRQQSTTQPFQDSIPPPTWQAIAPSAQQSPAPPVQDPNPATALPQAPSGELQYLNREQFEQATANRPIMHNWTPPQNDATFPKDLGDRAAYIKMLVSAFKSTDECLDVAHISSFQSRWVLPETAGSTSTIAEQKLETISWKLLEMALGLHTYGLASLDIRDKAKLKTASKHLNLTFGERIAHICSLLRLSKARCEKILKFETLEMVVAAPEQLAKDTKVNKQQNEVRQKNLNAGRAAKKQKEREAAPPMNEQELHEQLDRFVREHKEAGLLQRSSEGRKSKKKIQVYRDDAQKQSKKQVVEASSHIVQVPAQGVEAAPSKVYDAPQQIFEPAPSELFEPTPFQLFGDDAPEQEFFQMAPQGFNNVPPQGFNLAAPQFINPTKLQSFNIGNAQQLGEVPQQYGAAGLQNSGQQFAQPPSNNTFTSNVPELDHFSSADRGTGSRLSEVTIDPSLLSVGAPWNANALPSQAAFPHGNNHMHSSDQQFHNPHEGRSSSAKPNAPSDPSLDLQQETSMPQGFAALQQFNQQHQNNWNTQQQNIHHDQIYYGGNTYVPATSVGAGPMPLATNVGAENQPLQSNDAETRGAKRSRDVEEGSEFSDARPVKRKSWSKRG